MYAVCEAERDSFVGRLHEAAGQHGSVYPAYFRPCNVATRRQRRPITLQGRAKSNLAGEDRMAGPPARRRKLSVPEGKRVQCLHWTICLCVPQVYKGWRRNEDNPWQSLMTTPGIVSASHSAVAHGHGYSVASAYEKAMRQRHDHAGHTDNAAADGAEGLYLAVRSMA